MNQTIFYNIPSSIKIIYLEKSDPKESGIKKLLKLPALAWKYKKLNSSDISLSFMNRPNYINTLAKMMGMKSKVIISERAIPSLQHKVGIQGKINKLLIKILYSKADVITANSKGNSKDLINNFNIKNVVTIHNPFDVNKIKELSEEKITYRDNIFTFITIGRLDNGKNHNLMLLAMQNIDAKLYIIGDGELREQLEQQIIELELEKKVILLGRQENPYKYISKADCFVFSSNHEGFPNVLLEALACDLPVISTDCQSGPREILSPDSDAEHQIKDNIELVEYGILIPVDDEDNLIKAMDIMIKDEKLRESYKQKAVNRAKEFDKDIIIKEWIKILD